MPDEKTATEEAGAPASSPPPLVLKPDPGASKAPAPDLGQVAVPPRVDVENAPVILYEQPPPAVAIPAKVCVPTWMLVAGVLLILLLRE